MPPRSHLEAIAERLDALDDSANVAIAIRVSLRALSYVLTGPFPSNVSSLPPRAINLAYAYFISPNDRRRLESAVRRFDSGDTVLEAQLTAERASDHEAAAARRLYRAVAGDDQYPVGYLDRVAISSQQRAQESMRSFSIAVARATAPLVVRCLKSREVAVGLIGLVPRALPTHLRNPYWDSIISDLTIIESGIDSQKVFLNRLWINGPQRDHEIRNENFWDYWLRGFLTGQPLHRDVLRDVALIETRAGLESGSAFDDTLQEVELRRLRALAYLPEALVQNSTTGLYSVVPELPEDGEVVWNSIRKIEIAVARVSGLRGSNYWPSLNDILQNLSFAARNLVGHPLALHDDFVRAAKTLVRRIESEEIPARNEAIDNLVEDLTTGALDIRAAISSVEIAVSARGRLKLRPPDARELRSLRGQVDLKSRASDAELARQLNEDLETLSSSEVNGDEAKFAIAPAAQRLASRLSRIKTEDTRQGDEEGKRSRVLQAADAASRLEKGVGAVDKMVDYGWSWLHYLLSLM